jgi:hypothetical protein
MVHPEQQGIQQGGVVLLAVAELVEQDQRPDWEDEENKDRQRDENEFFVHGLLLGGNAVPPLPGSIGGGIGSNKLKA